jgi:hypothetical protein
MHISDLDPETRRKFFPDIETAVKTRAKPTARTKVDLRKSAEDAFVFQCRAFKLPMFKREFKFALDRGRGWRFDFCWPDFMLALECEGLVARYVNGEQFAYGRHATFAGFEHDAIKYATAAIMGWTVLRFNQRLITNGTAIDMTLECLKAKGFKP